MVLLILYEGLLLSAPGAMPFVAFVGCIPDRPPLAAEAAGEMAYLFIKIERFFFLLFSEQHRVLLSLRPLRSASVTVSWR